jgi:ferredoxin
MFRNVRIVSQIFFLTSFIVLLFFFNNQKFASVFPAEIFLQINPLVGVLVSIASRTIICALIPGTAVIILLTILFGRGFCGWICPLGTAIDFSDKFIVGKARHVSRKPPVYIQRLKYVLLFILTIAALFGFLLPFFMDPISIATRITTLIITPVINFLGITSADISGSIKSFLTKNKFEKEAFQPIVWGTSGALLTIVAVFTGGFWDKRFWCQYICPTGAFLGIISRVPLFRRRVNSEKCNNCKACSTRQCPVRAINHENIKLTNSSECIVCGVCATNKKVCTEFSFRKSANAPVHTTVLARRHFITAVLAGVVVPPMIKGSKIGNLLQSQPVRPPGSIPEDEFLTRCIACGECMKVCPNHALQPSGIFDGLMKLNTPYLAPSVGYCEAGCTACTHVCPTVAIRPIPEQDKPFIKIGTAIVDKNHCLAWKGEIKCLVCKSKCPYQAITAQDIECGELTMSGPLVDKELCTGCGICEKYCESRSYPAIKIFAHGERRISTGSFISERKKARILKARREIQDSEG